MKGRRVKMSVADYERLPFSLAWKQEYFDGCLVETPREVFVYATMPVAPHTVNPPVPLRPAVASDERLLHPWFVRAFADTIEFCDYPEAKLHAAAQERLARFFQRPPSDALRASHIAIGPPGAADAGEPIGAALVALEEGWAMLEVIFVAADWQRSGVASALAGAAVNALVELGGIRTLVSRYHLGNEASQAWHRLFGFVDEPDLLVARLRHRAAGDQCARNHWQREVERLETEPKETAFPSIKWRRKTVDLASRLPGRG